MGTFGYYTGSMYIPEEKREKFARQIEKILNYGGMMQFERISLHGYDLGLIKPPELYPGGKIHFYFNYFEDKRNKIGYRAAVKLLERIADENREEGKIIEKVKCSWDMVNRSVTHNVGRLKLKRYLSVMANHRLRKKYFNF